MKRAAVWGWLLAVSGVVCLPWASAYAQAPAWQTALAVGEGGFSRVEATATDASGSLYVAGSFSGTVRVGTTTLRSAGQSDIFVAKWSPATGTFSWAQRAGGSDDDDVGGLAVNGSNVYVTGYYYSSPMIVGGVSLSRYGGTGPDVFVAKFTDQGSFGQVAWAQRAGGTNVDFAEGIAVSGTSVYVVGSVASTTAAFGSTSLTGSGADVFVAKLTDAGNTGSFVWAQRTGGASGDAARAVVASGTSVYVVGGFDSPSIRFGSTTLTGTGADEFAFKAFVAKLTDAGASASFTWAKRCGNPGPASAWTVAVSGAAVYVGGTFNQTSTTFGATTLTNAGPANTNDVFITKYQDLGADASQGWAQPISGPADEGLAALVVRGTELYVAGRFGGSARVGSTTLTGAGVADVFVARLTDLGSTSSFAWAQPAGGTGDDDARSLALAGSRLYVGGHVTPPASFGSLQLTDPATTRVGFLASLTDPVLGVASPSLAAGLRVWPNPAQTDVRVLAPTLPGTAPATLSLLDTQGRVVRTHTASATDAGWRPLSVAGLAPGLYYLRVQWGAAQTGCSLVVE
jgi:hypothetical protein